MISVRVAAEPGNRNVALRVGGTAKPLVADARYIEDAFEGLLAHATPFPSPENCEEIYYSAFGANGLDLLSADTPLARTISHDDWARLVAGIEELQSRRHHAKKAERDAIEAFRLPDKDSQPDCYRECRDPTTGETRLAVIWGVGVTDWQGQLEVQGFSVEEATARLDRHVEPRTAAPRAELVPAAALAPAASVKAGVRSRLSGAISSVARALLAPLRRRRRAHRRGSPEIPGGRIDRVHFTVTSPSTVPLNSPFVINVWAHLTGHRHAVIRLARQEAQGGEIRAKSKGPVRVARGMVLAVKLKTEGIAVGDPEDTVLWDGDIGNATFPARVPEDAKPGPKTGVATIYIHGLQIAKIHFLIVVGAPISRATCVSDRVEEHRRAFASYSSADRDAVLARIQGILKVAPHLEVFLDVLSLRSGQSWEKELWNVIPGNDVFYLFWSENAKRSTWVEKEWRCALKTRGLDFIDPVPLASPEQVPPPPELADRHFNDWTLAFMRGKGPRA